MILFRFNYYDLNGRSSYLWWDSVDDLVVEKRIRELNPARRISRGKIILCISLSESLKLKDPKTIKQAVKLAEKHRENRIE